MKTASRGEKDHQWSGYKPHLIVEAAYEMPGAYKVTKASASVIEEGQTLLEQTKEKSARTRTQRKR